jgi:hypothetical protein
MLPGKRPATPGTFAKIAGYFMFWPLKMQYHEKKWKNSRQRPPQEPILSSRSRQAKSDYGWHPKKQQ